MSSQSSGVPIVEKSEVHTESIQQAQPMDLAPRVPAVVQIRPVRAFGGLQQGAVKAGGVQATVAVTGGTPASIISMNRTGPNLAILPAGRGTPGGAPAQIPAAAYQLARGTIVGSVRSNLSTGHQPGSITVTPISSSNFGANIRLTGPVNNGTWIQSSANATSPFASLRGATITVSNRTVRPDGKMIHIPTGSSVQHVAQLQMVDNKGGIIKPQITAPLVNMRGTLHPQGSTNAGTPLTLAPFPFTVRAATIGTIQQRPSNASANTANQTPKVITQPAHGPPIQLLNTQKIPHTIQTITPIPRLNTVCLTISTHGTIAPNNTAPVVTMASRQGGASLIMTPSIGAQVSSGSPLPITKVFPVRDGQPVVETIFATPQATTNPLSVGAAVNALPLVAQAGSGQQTNVVIASSNPSNNHLVPAHGPTSSNPQGHHVVQVGQISVNSGGTTVGVGLPQSSVTAGTMTPSYYQVDAKNLNLIQQQQHSHNRPVTIEKRTVTSGDATKNIVAGSTVILTTQTQPSANQHPTQTVTIPLAAHNAFSHPITVSHHQQPQVLQPHPVLNPVSSVSNMMTNNVVAQSQAQNVQMGNHTIPTHVISQQPLAAVTSSAGGGNVLTVSSSAGITSSSVIVTSSNAQTSNAVTPASSSCSTSTSASATSLQTSNPAQSPSQTKSTLSPRPSILRKREAADHNHHAVPLRAQRNLALNFSVGSSNIQVASASAAAAAAAAANKENSVVTVTPVSLGPSSLTSQCTTTSSSGTSSGISILKKEFQPPNEESSWQSCSSNSSSGSTTISTTSETAEIQMQQQQQQQSQQIPITSSHSSSSHHLVSTSSVGLPEISVPLASYGSICNIVTPSGAQNGIVRSVPGTTSTRPKSSNKTLLKDLERVKGRLDKDDGVSPRKKPRKQQLPSNDLYHQSNSPEISFYQGKRFKKSEHVKPKLFEDFTERGGGTEDAVVEDPPTAPRVVYHLKKPHMSLLQSNKFSSKPPQNHFQRYCDVKSKDERRPTVNDLLNQKNVIQKCNGWKLQHLRNQVEEIIELEGDVVDRFTILLNKLEAKVGPNSSDRDLNRIQELLKGNIQRGKVIRDQMMESKSQVLKILEHTPRVLDVINKYNSKRPIKKRERL